MKWQWEETGVKALAAVAKKCIPNTMKGSTKGLLSLPNLDYELLWWGPSPSHLPVLDHAQEILVEWPFRDCSLLRNESNTGLLSVRQDLLIEVFLSHPETCKLQLQPYLATSGQPPGKCWAHTKFSGQSLPSGPLALCCNVWT